MQFLNKHWGNYEFYQLIQGYPGGVIIFALNGDILEVNSHFAATLGCSEELIYEHQYTGISDADSHTTEAALLKNQALTKGHTDMYEKKYRVGNQKSVIVRQHVFLIRSADDQPQFFLAMLLPNDTTDSASEDAALSSSQMDNSAFKELVFLRKQNEQLQEIVKKAQAEAAASPDKKQLEALAAKVDKLTQELSASRESESKLHRKVTGLTTTLEWKDKEIEKQKKKQQELATELRQTKGELEVAQIIESQRENQPEEKEDDFPLPWDAENTTDDAAVSELESQQVGLPNEPAEDSPVNDAPAELDPQQEMLPNEAKEDLSNVEDTPFPNDSQLSESSTDDAVPAQKSK